MAHDHLEEEVQTIRRRTGGGRLIMAGVVGACALGMGLGLWARPSSLERGDAPPAPKPEIEAETSDRMLQIVLDDAPAPIGPLLEVMPAEPGHHPAPAPELMAPKAPPVGLMKVDAPVASQAPAAVLPAVIPAVVAEPKPQPAAPPIAKQLEPRPAPPKAVVVKAQTPKVEPRKAPTKIAKAETKAAKGSGSRKLAKVEKPEKKAPPARKKAAEVKLAKAEPKAGKAKAAAETKKLAKLATAVKAAPKTIKAKALAAERQTRREIQLAEARLAKAEKAKAAKAKAEKARAEKARAEKARATKLAEAKAKAAPKPKSKPVVEKASTPPRKKVAPRGEGPMRVARNSACSSADAGEALVCADPRFNQRDRQLQRAFRNAEAAGVPASALQRQQERWRQARAAAARDGSWAVEDVYEARIAELNDLARDAREY